MPSTDCDVVGLNEYLVDSSLAEEAVECRRNGYVLTGKFLGQGAYAKVYLGQAVPEKISSNSKLRRQAGRQKDIKVAIKIISTSTAPDIYITKFLPREVASMNRCYLHPNVIQLYDMFASHKRVYLVLEYAECGDLLFYVNRCYARKSHSNCMTEDKARLMFRDILSGVHFIHSRGVAHRDLKCENILLSKGNQAKLSDFGFAVQPRQTGELLLTHCGSYAYAPPEILKQQKYDGKLADLWSLGIILFAMVNGGLPFKESDAKAVLGAMKKPVYFKGCLTQDCKDLIRGLLKLKPVKRLSIPEVYAHSWMRKHLHQGLKGTGDTSIGCQAGDGGNDVIFNDVGMMSEFDKPEGVLSYLKERLGRYGHGKAVKLFHQVRRNVCEKNGPKEAPSYLENVSKFPQSTDTSAPASATNAVDNSTQTATNSKPKSSVVQSRRSLYNGLNSSPSPTAKVKKTFVRLVEVDDREMVVCGESSSGKLPQVTDTSAESKAFAQKKFETYRKMKQTNENLRKFSFKLRYEQKITSNLKPPEEPTSSLLSDEEKKKSQVREGRKTADLLDDRRRVISSPKVVNINIDPKAAQRNIAHRKQAKLRPGAISVPPQRESSSLLENNKPAATLLTKTHFQYSDAKTFISKKDSKSRESQRVKYNMTCTHGCKTTTKPLKKPAFMNPQKPSHCNDSEQKIIHRSTPTRSSYKQSDFIYVKPFGKKKKIPPELPTTAPAWSSSTSPCLRKSKAEKQAQNYVSMYDKPGQEVAAWVHQQQQYPPATKTVTLTKNISKFHGQGAAYHHRADNENIQQYLENLATTVADTCHQSGDRGKLLHRRGQVAKNILEAVTKANQAKAFWPKYVAAPPPCGMTEQLPKEISKSGRAILRMCSNR
ncbi:unnamed protein product [Clavelina lepadiformis]|uniref:non-specific serine/threonine protein kinase n=1 Tax=Clavelina lepadiformis TaxID=159417 RepID=A0ABP0G9G5_CLALP